MRNNQNKRYFGMTVIQLGILGCLGLVALGMVLGGGIFITTSLGSTGPSGRAPQDISATPEWTATPIITETPTLTPTATPFPYDELIPSGWEQHITSDIEIWLPTRFKSVNVENERREMIDLYQDIGLDEIARTMQENPSAYVFWFKASESDAVPYTANISIEFQAVSIESLDIYLDQKYINEESSPFRVVNRKEILGGIHQTRRILLESTLDNYYVAVAQYAIYDGTHLWFINCTAHYNEFYTLLPDFDKVARTFRLVGQ